MTPQQLAERSTQQILHDQQYVRDLVVDSPPGAGKTGVVERLALINAWHHDRKVMIATQTNAQAFDLARRLASSWTQPVYLFTRKGMQISDDLAALDNLTAFDDPDLMPTTACVVIANSRKWSYARVENDYFDLMIVEEAYQLRDCDFAQIAGFSHRHVLVGDPGQIAPVTSADITRWCDQPDGPHVPAPEALLRRRPGDTHQLKLPVSRRLPADTVAIVQPAFYSQLPFCATSRPEDRQLRPLPATDAHRLDGLIDRAAAGSSLVMGQLPDRITGETDTEIAQTIAELVVRLLQRGTETQDWEFKPEQQRRTLLTCEQIGVTCAHRSQVNAIQEQLGRMQHTVGDPADGAPDLSRVLVETSDRFQGLEKQVMIVHHPLAGRLSAKDFHLDAGRLCVMLSRHRVSCFIIGREGMLGRLQQQPPASQRVLGPVPDLLHHGNTRHQDLLELLHTEDRVVDIPAPVPVTR